MFNRLMSLALAGALSLGLMTAAVASQGTGCMPTVGIITGLAFSIDINAAIAATISSNSGSAAPTTDCSVAAVKGQVWLDTSVVPNIWRMYDGVSTWVPIGALDGSSHLWSPPVGGGTASVTAAATTNLCTAPSAVQNVLGTTTITSFGSTCVAGVRKTLIFAAATPLTYNATSLILPGQFSYTTTAGDVADAIYLGAGNWRIVSITKIDGSSITNPAMPLGTVLYGDYATIPAKTVYGAGQALSRASYPQYLAAVTRVQSATLTSGNATITSVGNTAGFGAGMPLEGTGIQTGATIVSVTSSTIVMSLTATANGAQTVTAFVTGYGISGSSSTVGVKDCRGRTIAGRDNLNGTAAGNLTSTYFGAGRLAINGIGGNETATMLLANLPPYTPLGTINNGAITNGVTGGVYGSNSSVASGVTLGGSGPFISGNNTLVSVTSTQASSTFAGTAQGGASTPFLLAQPTVMAECVVIVLP